MTKEWVKEPFKLDFVPKTIVLQATTSLVKGRGENVIVPTVTAQSPIRLEMVYQKDRELGYFKAQKGKKNGKEFLLSKLSLKLKGLKPRRQLKPKKPLKLKIIHKCHH